MSNSKTYKLFIHNNLNMIPGDPTGLPDDLFFMRLLNYLK